MTRTCDEIVHHQVVHGGSRQVDVSLVDPVVGPLELKVVREKTHFGQISHNSQDFQVLNALFRTFSTFFVKFYFFQCLTQSNVF